MIAGLIFLEIEMYQPRQKRGCCQFPAPLRMHLQCSFLSRLPSMTGYRLPSLKGPLSPGHYQGNKQIPTFLFQADHRGAGLQFIFTKKII